MSKPYNPVDDDEIIDVRPPSSGLRWRRWVIAALVVLFISSSSLIGVYISVLWFESLGYQDVYWYILKLKVSLFVVFLLLTTLILRGAFWLLEKTFSSQVLAKRTILLNEQAIEFSPARFLKPAAWLLAGLFGLMYAIAMSSQWQVFALYLNQPAGGPADPIFQQPLGFYFFSLPLYDSLSSWLVFLAFVILAGTLVYSFLTLPEKVLKTASQTVSKSAYRAISIALASFLVVFALRVYLSRYPYLWTDHQTFSGVTYTEHNYLLPALLFISVALVIGAVIALVNAFTQRRLRLLLVAVALPVLVYVIGVVIVPAYIQSFIVKPNELGRETPYITHNIAGTREAFGLNQVEQRNFEADTSIQALDLAGNRDSLENIRLWDWQALQDTLKQIQAIRIYYDFFDVDVDRYQLEGQTRQMMVAAREIATDKLPEASRNWINQKLIYTHGYGVTMNTANGFTREGMPLFVVSNMPVESTAPELKVTRPQIYYGQLTNTDVYVKTKQQEFDFPQGETDTSIYTTYEGNGGIKIGGPIRRLLLAWALGDLAKLPFSDDVTSESHAMIRRNILQIVNHLAPFLIYDNDPYMVVNEEGRLFWIIDAYTQSASYPYSRHHRVANYSVNYIRNSVKVVIDAYHGTTDFYVFDQQDPLIAAYSATFPSLFKNADQMPADLRSHVRYPETLFKVQGEVYGLYHTQNPTVFFQREDIWNVANRITADEQQNRQSQPIDPYFVLMRLPEEKTTEFVLILPFTPNNRNNMIGWLAGRSDGENYGKLVGYNFPQGRLIDGPVQIEARIDQNAQLAAQFSLWNQQGSRVIRGHLLVIPMGRSLLFVEPIYLQAVRSPMPELRLVVLATQERLGFGTTFAEAMTHLVGTEVSLEDPDEPDKPTEEKPTADKPAPTEPTTRTATPEAVQRLIIRALQEFEEYQRLTAQGRLAEAGQKLEQHKRTLEELRGLVGR